MTIIIFYIITNRTSSAPTTLLFLNPLWLITKDGEAAVIRILSEHDQATIREGGEEGLLLAAGEGGRGRSEGTTTTSRSTSPGSAISEATRTMAGSSPLCAADGSGSGSSSPRFGVASSARVQDFCIMPRPSPSLFAVVRSSGCVGFAFTPFSLRWVSGF